MTTLPDPDPAPVLDLIDAFRRSKTMFAAVHFGIFDRTPATLATLAAVLEVHAASLERLLDGCVGLGFLRKHSGSYVNTEVADAYLRRSSPRTMAGYILYSNQVLFRMWANLEDAIQEGMHRWQQTFRFEGPIFNHFFQSEEARRDFLMGMHGLGLLTSPAVVAAFDLSRFHRMVDLGGATGHLALAARERHPRLSVAVFDLPGVVPYVTQGVDAIAGDFFTDPLPAADLYAVGRILHDWSEEKIRVLLAKVFAALPEGGGLLIAERLVDDDRSGPVPALMQSLNMLICTEGRERTFGEYKTLLREAGFREIEGRRTGTALDALLALK
jgi:acetylserotonin N-methyltransferase